MTPTAEIDKEGWSGEGDFTQQLVDWLMALADVTFLHVVDAPSTRSDVEYNFIANEIFVGFRTKERVERHRVFGVWPVRRTVTERTLTLDQLEGLLTDDEAIGAPDFADEGMIQYLRTERIIPPYQTKGYKLIELVRLYEVGTAPRK